MNWLVLTDKDNDPVLINADDISCILVSNKIPKGSTIWFKNQENEALDVKESLVEIYTQMSKPHNNFELLDRYDRKEPIMQEVPKPKITRWEKWAKSVEPENYREIICGSYGSCSQCVMKDAKRLFNCGDDTAAKAYLLEEVDDIPSQDEQPS